MNLGEVFLNPLQMLIEDHTECFGDEPHLVPGRERMEHFLKMEYESHREGK